MLPSLHKLSELKIFYINDIITMESKNVLEWNQVNIQNGRPAQRDITPTVYNIIRDRAKKYVIIITTFQTII